MLDASEKLDLAARVSEMSKIGVSDVVTRFFGEYRAKAAPLWANIEKLENLAVDIQLNADYLTDAENSALRAAYETVIAAYRGLTK